MSVDQIISVLADSLSMAKSLPGALGALVVAVIAVAISLLIVAKYFSDKGAREREAYLLDLEIKKTQLNNLANMQKDLVVGLLQNMDISYKQDYEFYIQKIAVGKYDAIYPKIAPKFHQEIASFLYDASVTPEQRAARIILTIRPH